MRYTVKRVCLAASLWVAIACAAPAAACGVGDLGFLAGVWRSEQGNTRGEERWTLTAAGTWAGSSWVADGAKLNFAEVLGIVPQDGTLEMHLRHFDGALNHAWEERDGPMRFRLASCEPGVAVFEGLGDKAGERITYRRSGETLEFVGDFLRKGQPFRVEVRMQRIRGEST
jgi:hypothetical protein